MADDSPVTTRAYTLRLSGEGRWRELLWKTHVTVNRGAQVWGDWLLTLRGGLPASLADVHSERRVLLALSWLSVESPSSLAPHSHVVATGLEENAVRQQNVLDRFSVILARLQVHDPDAWVAACQPALTARIRDDAVWVDRSSCFAELQEHCPGLNSQWAADTLFDFLGGEVDYFALPDTETTAATEPKDFVQKAGGWLSPNWGAGKKSDATAIGTRLAELAEIDPSLIIGSSGREALSTLLLTLGQGQSEDDDTTTLFKKVKQAIGWKGHPSTGAIALAQVGDAEVVSAGIWQRTVQKFKNESTKQSSKTKNGANRPEWMDSWRTRIETVLGMPFRARRDLKEEQSVTLDHALRRVSAAHTWIKRAEAERCRFRHDAARIADVAQSAREWLDAFRETRSSASGAFGDYLIRKRAIDGWDKIVQAWAALDPGATRSQRIAAAREVQANLDDNEKFGDIQLFAGFGDEDTPAPQACLADDDALCVWRADNGKPAADVLKDYVYATTAEHDQRRFKVPAYRHPDPLRNPIYVDFGNSRWGITYSALKASQHRVKLAENLAKAKTDKTRAKLRAELESPPDLRNVTLRVWNGESVEPLKLRWQGKRLWNDLDLEHFDIGQTAKTVSRADRLGRIAAGEAAQTAVRIAEVFQQKDWNGRLQVPRGQLDRLAELAYGKDADPDVSMLESLLDNARARRAWERLDWFLTTSAKLRPQGPWLDYVAAGLPEGIEYKKGRSGYYLNYAENQGRKSRARLQLARLPGLRVLSLDLGHRYAAACAVWETITSEKILAACQESGHARPTSDTLYLHLRRSTNRIQKRGRNKGKPVEATTVYRRIGPDVLPDGSVHPAPWARLERQFLIKLQGEDCAARRARPDEIDAVNALRDFLGMPRLAETPRIDQLQRDAARLARLGLRRLGDMARIAFAMTATQKPISGGREVGLSPEQRIDYLQESLLLWRELAESSQYVDPWASQAWHDWVAEKFGGPPTVKTAEDAQGWSRTKKKDATRGLRELTPVAARLADPCSKDAVELHGLWAAEYASREQQWRKHLRSLRRMILPRKKDCPRGFKDARGVGGLSVKRLKTIRDLYQVLKAFHMRPEPDNLRKNIPSLGDESLANFGRRILNQLERLREQRIKQLASRVVEAALGAGRMKKPPGRDRKRPRQSLDRPCHAVVVENLERYKPEGSRLRRENRQLMDWAARNVRKYIIEGCELHGLHFVEVSPNYTSRQDSRTGAPGIRCEELSREVFVEAARRVQNTDALEAAAGTSSGEMRFEREVRRCARELRLAKDQNGDPSARDLVMTTLAEGIRNLPASRPTICLPRQGGDLFVSVATDTGSIGVLQADLNAAANIGLRVLSDPDWMGAWWFVLVSLANGQPNKDKVQGCPLWNNRSIWDMPDATDTKPSAKRGAKRPKTDVYAWNPMLATISSSNEWLATKPYWAKVERRIADCLRLRQIEAENPF